jgi:hypothetical protein
MTTRRCYRWIRTESGADVQFDDGRPFHSVDLSRTRPQASHDCPPDRYDVTYDFGQWPVWSLHWIVKGPRKDYSMTTWFRRG